MSDILGILRSFEPRADNPRILVTHAIQATRDAALDEYNTLREASAILAAVREEDDLVSRLESVAMSWCLAGLHDALNRVKRESTKSYADLVDAMRYAMSALAPNPDNANGAGDQRWEDGALAERFAALGEWSSAFDREPDGDPGPDADE